MKTAYLHLRYNNDRFEAFSKGLSKAGFIVKQGTTETPNDGDIFVSWNRIGYADTVARRFMKVIIVENSAWGNGFCGDSWLSLARDRHNTSGMFPIGENQRWDSLGIELEPFRAEGETVILPQRGIGSPPTAMPREWVNQAYQRYGGRVRAHPGKSEIKPLKDDLAKCGRVITWGSGAAIKALIWGIPVISEMPDWIGQQDNTDDGRLNMFRRLAWAQWRMSEIASGEPFVRLCES